MAINSPIPTSHSWFIGDDFAQPFAVVDGNGDAVDITGWTFSFTLRRRVDDADVVLLLTTGAGISILSASAGTLTVAVAAAVLSALGIRAGEYQYTLRRTNSGSVRTLAYGPAQLQKAA